MDVQPPIISTGDPLADGIISAVLYLVTLFASGWWGHRRGKRAPLMNADELAQALRERYGKGKP